LSWLAELQPEMFCEIGPELAREKELSNGDWATISTARGEIECRVLVTERIRALRIRGRTVQQIGLPYHWAGRGLSTGETANELVSFVADPNVSIQESKALTGNIEAGRKSKRRRSVTSEPWLPDVGPTQGPGDGRDLPAVGERPQGRHGLEAGKQQESEQA
jgi:formate dehydrogenase major subunit